MFSESSWGHCTKTVPDLLNPWVQVKLQSPAKIKTVLIVNKDNSNYPADVRINPSEIRVGSEMDITLNPSCGGSVTSGGVFNCGLIGQYIGVIQFNTERQNLCELRVYAHNHVQGTADVSMSSTNVDPGNGSQMEASRAINPTNLITYMHRNHAACTVTESWPWYELKFGDSIYINLVTFVTR